MQLCKLCRAVVKQVTELIGPIPDYSYECPRCGTYLMDDYAKFAEPIPFVKKRLYLISAVARWMSDRGVDDFLRVDKALLEDRSEFEAKILSVCPLTTQEKMDRILAYVAEKSSPGASMTIYKESDYPLFYCTGEEEVQFWLNSLDYLALLGEVNSGDTKDHWELKLLA